MGNSNACCAYDPKQNGKAGAGDQYTKSDVADSSKNQPQSSNNLQHISDREPEGMFNFMIYFTICY